MAFENPTDTASADVPSTLDIPVLAIRNTVIFPVLAFPINVGRSKSVRAVEEALATEEKYLGIFAQRDPKTEDPDPSDLYQVGTVVKILKMVKVPGNKLNVIIQGLARARVDDWEEDGPFLQASLETYQPEPPGRDAEGLMDTLRELAQKIIDLSPQIPAEASFLVRSIDEPGVLADIVASNLNIPPDEKQDLLETFNTHERMQKVIALLNKEIQVLELSNKIQTEVKGEMDKAQREYFLREQLKAIQKELGEVDERQEEFEEIKRAIKRAKMPKEVEEVAFKELKRMSRMSPGAAEYTVSRTYIDWLSELPWSISSKDRLDVNEAERILEDDHYGLDKVKQRILEFLAVRKLKQDMKGPILCLVGPPGVGKTSLAKSVARALGRKTVRIALGGVRDEAEIRGHRRTYIGSMPGKVIKGIKKAGTNNPVFVLDEIDKLGADYRGDPSSALLEVLDPEQNDTFSDHYLDVAFDLSKVLFIATANVPDTIPGPLRDRMEIIRIAGYTHNEKEQIAKRYLWPECLEDHGLTDEMVELPQETLDKVIESYTREAGVRSLKRELAAICRWTAREIASERREAGFPITPELLEEIRGPIHYWKEVAERTAVPGVATGLAWTSSGGEILFIEATKMRGKGSLTLTGSLGDVMKESVSVARSFIRSCADEIGIDDQDFDTLDLHVHVPSGAIPKDGPSAGVTMITAISSLLTGLKVDPTIAMTGEITLRGAVLPVGGVKEKVLAAHRAGIKTVILPEKCRKDLIEVPDEIQEALEFRFVSRMEEVLDIALGAEQLADVRRRLALRRQQEAAGGHEQPTPLA
ncbi:MAG TPA: endopeptidase La [Deltaproteobacteria bacterium]|nr:endopeptidase La [Deltaproteobacteria bacterium]